jgi:hypothetical protein
LIGDKEMRMWMVNPKNMCRKHLLGEHLECHMFAGTLKKEISINGYISNNLFEPTSLISRHDDLRNEIIRRGYNHKSEININEVINSCQLLSESQMNFHIDKIKSYNDLISRCSECKKLEMI